MSDASLLEIFQFAINTLEQLVHLLDLAISFLPYFCQSLHCRLFVHYLAYFWCD